VLVHLAVVEGCLRVSNRADSATVAAAVTFRSACGEEGRILWLTRDLRRVSCLYCFVFVLMALTSYGYSASLSSR